jgi:hypothetical protein
MPDGSWQYMGKGDQGGWPGETPTPDPVSPPDYTVGPPDYYPSDIYGDNNGGLGFFFD